MKSKLTLEITFGETIDITAATEVILNLQNYTIGLLEEEHMSTPKAHEEANKLIFAKPFYNLGGNTVAQWVAKGGAETKALEVIKDLISDVIKQNNKVEEQKVIMAKVFSK